MQLFAWDSDKQLILASKAQKKADYFCPECQALVRARSGPYRTAHFYHFSKDGKCRQGGKSLEHLQAQLMISQELEKQAVLEHRFSQIDRIADVFWPSQKIVFEVQCSPISAKEVLSRNADYHSIGLQVVWVLHRQTFLKKRASSAEIALIGSPHYFTDIDITGRGEIYDQNGAIIKGIRKNYEARTKVCFKEPMQLSKNLIGKLMGRPFRKLYFKGDLFDQMLRQPEVQKKQSFYKSAFASFRIRLRHFITVVYRYFLEKCL